LARQWRPDQDRWTRPGLRRCQAGRDGAGVARRGLDRYQVAGTDV